MNKERQLMTTYKSAPRANPMRVRKGSVYVFKASLWDIADRHANTPPDGTLVRVVHPYGCPAPNTMGHCHVATLEGKFIGLVSCASLRGLDGYQIAALGRAKKAKG